MLKRFLIGFVLGIVVMYWFIHSSGDVMSDASGWMERSASRYRGDRQHQAVDEQTGQRP